MIWCKQNFILWVLSGIFFGVGLTFPTFWAIGFAGGILFLCLLLQDGASFLKKLGGAVTAWTVKASFAVGWLWSTYPIDWLPVDFGRIQLVLIGFSWFMTAFCLGLGVLFLVVTIWSLRKIFDFRSFTTCVFVIPPLWILSESLGSFLFSLFFYGPGGTLNVSFSFGFTGYLLAEHDLLLQGARLAGVYSLSYIFVVLCVVLLWLSKQAKKMQYISIGVVLILYGTSFVPLVTENTTSVQDTYKVVTVDTKVGSRLHATPEGRDQVEQTITEAVAAAVAQEPTHIILPEDSRYFDHTQPISTITGKFQAQFNPSQLVLVDSSRVQYDHRTVQQAFVYDSQSDEVERFHKRYLVPQGEFLSYIYAYVLTAIGYSGSVGYIGETMSYRVGPWISQSKAGVNVPGILFCFESFAPQGVRALQKERSNMPFVAHIASHSWFHEPYTLWSQMESMLQVQSVWSQHHIVSAGNMMSGKVYTPSGEVRDMAVVASGERWEVKQVSIPR